MIVALLFGCANTRHLCAIQTEAGIQGETKRSLEVLDVGYHLPVEIVAVRHLQSKHWMRDLELEIRNVSDKPIYGVYVGLLLPDDKDIMRDAYRGASLFYGRTALATPDSRRMDDDKPILPGESIVLKVEEMFCRGYERHVQSSNIAEKASYRVRMIIETVNFGDGTGFANGGVPYPFDRRTTARYVRYVSVLTDPK